MSFFLFAVVAVVLVAALSRDYESTPLQQVVATARLDLDDAALGALPDRIHVSPCSRGSLTYADRVGDAKEALRALGFEDVGAFAVDELPGIHVVLAVHARDSFYAAIYDHAAAGVWVDVVSCYRNGTRSTHSTLDGLGHESRPGHTRVTAPGATVTELVARARSERPTAELRKLVRLDVAPLFEQGYSDWSEWRLSGIESEAREAMRVVERGRSVDDQGLRQAA